MGRRNRSFFGLMLVGASAVALYLWRNRRVRDYARSLLAPASDCVRDFIKKTLRPQVETDTGDGKLVVTGLSPPEARPLSTVSQVLSWDPSAATNPDQPFCRTYNTPLLLPARALPRPPVALLPATTPAADNEAAAGTPPTEGAVAAADGALSYGGVARPRLLVCHDMMGGYLADRLVQGAADAGAFRLWHWDCIDVFVYFSHHMVTLPPPGWIAAAHRNGVRVLGTFITEGPLGRARCEALFSTPAAARRTADTLAALAAHYGFEGWLINVENSLAHPQVECLRHAVAHLRARLAAAVGPAATVVWYDAVTTEGRLAWQDGLTPLNAPFFDTADALFVNYRWKEGAPAAVAAAAGSRAADVFMGVDVFGRGSYGGGKDNCPVALSAARSAGLSAALFAPGWVYEEFERSGFERRQEAFWGAIRAVWTPRPAQLVTLPLTSTFNIGAGRAVWLEGRRVSTAPWHNLAAQDMLAATTNITTTVTNNTLASTSLPTIPNPLPTAATTITGFNRRSTNPGLPTYGPLSVRTTQQLAFYGGSCLALTATATEAVGSGGGAAAVGGGPWLHQLYSAHLAVPAAGLDLSYTIACAGSSRVAVVLRTAPAAEPVAAGSTRVGGWCGVAVGPWSAADRPVVEALRRAGYICIACPATPTGATTSLSDSLTAPATSATALLTAASAVDTAAPAAGLPWVTCAAHLPAKVFMQLQPAPASILDAAAGGAAEPAFILGVSILCYHSPVALGTTVGGGVSGGAGQPAGSSSASGKGSSARGSTSGFTAAAAAAAATATAAAMAAAVSVALEGADGAVSYSAYLGKLVLREHRPIPPGLSETPPPPLTSVAPAANTPPTTSSSSSMQPLLITPATAPQQPQASAPLAGGRCSRIRWGRPLTAGSSSRVRSLRTSFNSLSGPGSLNAAYAAAAAAAIAAAGDPRASDELLDSDEDWDHHSCAAGAGAAAATGGSPVKVLSADVASDELDLIGGVGEDSLEVVGRRRLGGGAGEEGEAAEVSHLLTCELSWEPQFDACGIPRHRSYHVWALFDYGAEPPPPLPAATATATPPAVILPPDAPADGDWSSAVWAGEAHVAAFRLVQLEVPPAATSVSFAVQPLDWATADVQRLQPMARLGVPSTA